MEVRGWCHALERHLNFAFAFRGLQLGAECVCVCVCQGLSVPHEKIEQILYFLTHSFCYIFLSLLFVVYR